MGMCKAKKTDKILDVFCERMKIMTGDDFNKEKMPKMLALVSSIVEVLSPDDVDERKVSDEGKD